MRRYSALALCLATMGASASASTLVQGTFSAEISDPTSDSSFFQYTLGDSGTGTNNQLIWGRTSTEDGVVPTLDGSSVLTIDDFGFGGNVAEGGGFSEIQLGSLAWTNKSNYSTGLTWDTLGITLSLGFTTQSGSTVPVDLSVDVVNTRDAFGTAEDNNQTGLNPDVVTNIRLGDGNPFERVDLGGVFLEGIRLAIVEPGSPGTPLDPQDPNSPFCTFGGVGSIFASEADGGVWENCEGNTSTLGVFGDFSYVAVPDDEVPPPVPLPAAGYLLIGGLGGLYALRRRQRKAA